MPLQLPSCNICGQPSAHLKMSPVHFFMICGVEGHEMYGYDHDSELCRDCQERAKKLYHEIWVPMDEDDL